MHIDPTLRTVWLFGPGADSEAHQNMQDCGAQVLIQDLEDFTPPNLRPKARELAEKLFQKWRGANSLVCVRINSIDGEGLEDLRMVMPFRPDIIAYPKAETAQSIKQLDRIIGEHEHLNGIKLGQTEILPVCETALGVVEVRALAAASPRVHHALLGAEDLAADLQAERGADAVELDYARRRFLLECRAAKIEPVDAPYTFSDIEGCVKETLYAKRLGYQCKSLVNPAMVRSVLKVLRPSDLDISLAKSIVAEFEAAREKGLDRVLVAGQWIEVPTYLNAQRLLKKSANF